MFGDIGSVSGKEPQPDPMSGKLTRDPGRSGVPPALINPIIDLAPVPGCDLCDWWDRRRENARRGIGEASAAHCAGQIAAHPHRRAGDAG
ncbi:hypothetical protein [Streptomyces sp. NPDC059092]|uniref:hypothetical protein n=1 Tax=Streptomyces sp. NPDC059092 TaxID=3346725 RepID=UPI0036B62038